MVPLILASSSPRRALLLREAKFPAEVVHPEVAELSCDFLTASELARLNAKIKAAAVAAAYPDAVILGADTVVALGAEIFGKPKDLVDAARILQRLAGKTHEVITGVALMEGRGGRITLRAVSSAVTLRSLSNDEIHAYFKDVNPLDKAGAYAAQHSANAIVERIDGSFTNVVGLPMELIGSLLPSVGIHPSSADRLSSR
ncbi:MAG: septum formation protein Maf [Verrucomicrobia bacterium]|nr:septum formation protein Maf [Verrucomicrobiota bacterium]